MELKLNNIYLGDAYELIKQIPSKSIDLIVTDPPYEFQAEGGGCCFGPKHRQYHEDIANLSHEDELARVTNLIEKGKQEISHMVKGFDFKILDEFQRILKTMNCYIWCSKNQIRKLLDWFEDRGYFTDILTWHKDNPIPKTFNTYLSDTEYCIYVRGKGAYLGGSYETKHKYYVTHSNQTDKKKYKHPTIKPLNIIKNLIINSSLAGGVVLDPFIGSGTTAVACKELGRNYLGFEIDENYYQISIDRLNGVRQDEKQQGITQMKLFDEES